MKIHRLSLIAALLGCLTLLLSSGGTPALAASVDEMPPQMRQAFIVGIQEELQSHGYRPGAADGRLGGRTLREIRRYQRDAGLPVDGVASSELLDHLKFVRPKVFARRTSPAYGDRPAPRDPIVSDIQRELRQLGYYRGPIDGIAGPMTRAAVSDFSQVAGLPAGVGLDYALLDRLRAANAGPAPSTGSSQ